MGLQGEGHWRSPELPGLTVHFLPVASGYTPATPAAELSWAVNPLRASLAREERGLVRAMERFSGDSWLSLGEGVARSQLRNVFRQIQRLWEAGDFEGVFCEV